MKIVTGIVRFSYVNVFEPKSVNGGEPKYSVSLIIPKTDFKTLAKINTAIEAAKQEGLHKFGGSIPTGLRTPLRDGDVERSEDNAYNGSYFINANSVLKPGVVDTQMQPLDAGQFYSGCFGRASISFYAYNTGNGNMGIACGLQNLLKLEDGPPLGGPSSPAEDFGSLTDADF